MLVSPSMFARFCALLPLAALAGIGGTEQRSRARSGSAPSDTTALVAFADSIDRGAFAYVDGILVVRDGLPVFSRSWPRNYAGVYPMTDPPGPFNYHDPAWHPYYRKTALHTLQSITKSVTSILFGMAVDRGDLAGIDQPIAQFFPRHRQDFLDPRKQRITIRHLAHDDVGDPVAGGWGV